MRPWIRNTLFGLFGATLALGSLAFAQRCAHERFANMSEAQQGEFRQRLVDRVAGRLALDAQQKARLETLARKLHEQRLAVRGAGDPRAELRALVAGDRFDRERAQAFVGAKVAAATAASPELVAAFGDFFDGLQPPQQEKVREFLQRRGRHGWRRG